MLTRLVWRNRTRVARAIKGDGGAEAESHNWLTLQFAAVWHILALAYLLSVWLACATRVLLYGPDLGGALIRSLLVVPLFLVLDRLMRQALPAIMGPDGDVAEENQPDPDRDPNDDPRACQNFALEAILYPELRPGDYFPDFVDLGSARFRHRIAICNKDRGQRGLRYWSPSY